MTADTPRTARAITCGDGWNPNVPTAPAMTSSAPVTPDTSGGWPAMPSTLR